MNERCTEAAPLVLVVEDEPAALRLVEEAFDENGCPDGYVVATDGVEAFDVLYGRGRHAGGRRPDFVLLDLDLPRMSGQQLLGELNDLGDVNSVPVVVLSQTNDDDTVAECSRLGASAFIEKPDDYDGMVSIVGTLLDAWASGWETPPGGLREGGSCDAC